MKGSSNIFRESDLIIINQEAPPCASRADPLLYVANKVSLNPVTSQLHLKATVSKFRINLKEIMFFNVFRYLKLRAFEVKRAGVSPSSYITIVFFEFPSRYIKNISKKPAVEIIINKIAVLIIFFLIVQDSKSVFQVSG